MKQSELDNLLKDDSGIETEGALEGAIASADSLIDGYLKKVLTAVPISPVPESIKQTSYFIALYYLHDRIQYTDIPQRVKDNYDAALNFLKDVAGGKVDLGGADDADLDDTTGYWVDDNIFNREVF
jgi:phage gp36-like protein